MRAIFLIPANITIGLALVIIGMLLSACDEPSPPTPTAPIMQASLTIDPVLPTERQDTSIGRSDPTSAALAGEGEPSLPARTPTPQPTLDVLPFQSVAEDGAVLQYVFYAGRSNQAPVVMLLHDVGSSSTQWIDFAVSLQQLGYNVVVPDQRGHGDSGGTIDWSLAVTDLQTISSSIVQLGLIAPNSMAFIGRGTGANVAVASCAQISSCITTVALSPQGDPSSVEISAIVAAFGNRSLLIVSADDDEMGTTAADQLNRSAGGEHFWQRYSSGGVDLLMSQPELSSRIQEWLQARLAVP